MNNKLFVLLLILSLCSCTEPKEIKVSERELPEAVIKAFSDTYPNASVREYSMEKKNGEALYEISFVFEGVGMDVGYSAEGQALEIERTIQERDLPGIITREIDKKYDTCTIVKAEFITAGGEEFYEVLIGVDSGGETKFFELKFTIDGTLIEETEETEEID